MAELTLFYKGRAITAYRLDTERLTIGRKQSCDITIDSTAADAVHAVLSRSGDEYRIKPSGSDQQLIINHIRVDVPHILAHGDVIQIGPYSLSFSETIATLKFGNNGQSQAKKASPQPTINAENTLPAGCLQIISGEHLGKTIPLQRALLRLGLTGNQCSIIAHRSDGYYLSHLEGNHQPTVNGKPIADQSVRLHNGNVIQIGDIKLRFYEEIDIAAAV